MRVLRFFLAVAAVASWQAAEGLPAGFEEQGVVHIKEVVDIDFFNTTMFVVAKTGILYTYNLETQDDALVALDISDEVCSNGERGMGTVMVHPNYTENRWVYLFYTYNRGDTACLLDPVSGPINRCSRFTVNADNTVNRDSEFILFETMPLPDKIHNGGDMDFGVDGMLYVTVGDAGKRGSAWAQDRSHLFGKVLRLTDAGEIPPDNPYIGEGTAPCSDTGGSPSGSSTDFCQEIFAYGLRNPFRFTMDPHSTDKVRYLVSDVGGKFWEEISVGGADYAGANYGWPMLEGPCELNSYTSCPVDADLHDPIYYYPHDEEEAGCVNAVAIPPPGLNWPAPYNDPSSFYYVDFVFGEIYHVTEDATTLCRQCTPPQPGYNTSIFHIWERGVGLKFGPYKGNQQALYYTAREGDPNIRRIVYNGGDNFAPIAAFSADTWTAPVDGVIVFSAENSTDQNHPNEDLTFTWDFGDGSPTETGIEVEHPFDKGGVYVVSMTVSDPEGASAMIQEEVAIGTLPKVQISSPVAGSMFAVGDVFTLVGNGTDSEGNPLADKALSWEVRQHHNNHFHPFLDPTPGNDIVITEAPEPEDFFGASNSYLEILLTGTDDIGLSATVSLKVMPKVVYLEFDSNPPGLNLTLDEEDMEMPQRVLSWENHMLRVIAPDQGNYVFSSWADGVAENQTDEILVPPAAKVQRYVANFKSINGTEAPVPSPSKAPVQAPTKAPVQAPTKAPVQAPTKAPVPAPTEAPKSSPTLGPSRKPVQPPSGGTEFVGGNEFPPDDVLTKTSSGSAAVVTFWMAAALFAIVPLLFV